jgi:hypothetical protein
VDFSCFLVKTNFETFGFKFVFTGVFSSFLGIATFRGQIVKGLVDTNLCIIAFFCRPVKFLAALFFLFGYNGAVNMYRYIIKHIQENVKYIK